MKIRTKQQQVSRLNGALIEQYINQKHEVRTYPRLIIVTNEKETECTDGLIFPQALSVIIHVMFVY